MREMKSLTLNDKTYDSFVDGVARPLAEASAIVCSASGTSISVADSSDHNLVGLHIYGKSTQAGTPTPDAQVDIVSIGDDGALGVTVGADDFAMVLQNGLCGIKVKDKTLATYTDASGQMWCADEVDLTRGVRIHRIKVVTLDGSETWSIGGKTSADGSDWYYTTTQYADAVDAGDGYALCTHYPYAIVNNGNDLNGIAIVWRSIRIRWGTMGTVADWKSWLATQKANGNPVTVIFRLATPVETPLTEEEIASIEALHTNKPSTTVTNDSGAYMTLEYVADAKAYIDSRFASAILPATVE